MTTTRKREREIFEKHTKNEKKRFVRVRVYRKRIPQEKKKQREPLSFSTLFLAAIAFSMTAMFFCFAFSRSLSFVMIIFYSRLLGGDVSCEESERAASE